MSRYTVPESRHAIPTRLVEVVPRERLSIMVSTRLPWTLRKRIEAMALRYGCSVSDVVRQLVEAGLDGLESHRSGRKGGRNGAEKEGDGEEAGAT